MVQTLIVSLIVMAAVIYSGWHLMPAGLRRAAAARLAIHAARLGVAEDHARQLQVKLSATGGCSDCNSCGACATPTDKQGPPAVAVIAMPKRGVHRVQG